MNLIPLADPIPVPWGWFELFLTITFVCHILLMNVMVGTPIIALASRFFNKNAEPFSRDIIRKLPVIIALAVNLGVGALLFLQVLYGHFIYVSATLMAVFWLSIVLLVILAYYNAYYSRLNEGAHWPALISAAVLGFLVVAFFFSNVMTLMLHPEKWAAYFSNPSGTILNLSDPTLIPRYLHFMTAAVAVSGLFIALVWERKQTQGDTDAGAYVALGMKWFTYATMIQVLVGFAFQMTLPRPVFTLFLGGSWGHTLLFGAAMLLVVQTLFFGIRQHARAAAGSLLLLVLAMVSMRTLVRQAYLAPYFSVNDLPVTGQYSPMVVFLVCFAAVAACVAWVLKTAHSETDASRA